MQLRGLYVNVEDSFLRNFNNLIFLQKHHKVKKIRHRSPIASIYSNATSMTFPNGTLLFYNMMNY